MDVTESALHDSIVTTGGITTRVNALDLLRADHRQLERWFEQFARTRDGGAKQRIAADICKALQVHMTIEEEIFYPALLDATDDESQQHAALEENEAARMLMEEIRLSPGPREDRDFDVRVQALEQLIHHQVDLKEKRDGIFAAASGSGLDLDAMGLAIEHRKIELMDDEATDRGYDAAVQRPDEGEEIDTDFEADPSPRPT